MTASVSTTETAPGKPYGFLTNPRWNGDDVREFCIEQDLRFQAALRASLPRVVLGDGPVMVNVVINRHEPVEKPQPAPIPNFPQPVHWKRILHEVARKHNLTPASITGQQRTKVVVEARHEAVWRMTKETSLSKVRIGRLMGGRDHTTILHSCRRYEERLASGNLSSPQVSISDGTAPDKAHISEDRTFSSERSNG